MAFDLFDAVQQARIGMIPPEWRRFPLRGQVIWTIILTNLIVVIGFMGIAVNVPIK